MSDDEITMPDFKEWASKLINNNYFGSSKYKDSCGHFDLFTYHEEVVSEALQQAFEQGRVLGMRQEYSFQELAELSLWDSVVGDGLDVEEDWMDGTKSDIAELKEKETQQLK